MLESRRTDDCSAHTKHGDEENKAMVIIKVGKDERQKAEARKCVITKIARGCFHD